MRVPRSKLLAGAILLGACLFVAPAVKNLLFDDAAGGSDPSTSGERSCRPQYRHEPCNSYRVFRIQSGGNEQ